MCLGVSVSEVQNQFLSSCIYGVWVMVTMLMTLFKFENYILTTVLKSMYSKSATKYEKIILKNMKKD